MAYPFPKSRRAVLFPTIPFLSPLLPPPLLSFPPVTAMSFPAVMFLPYTFRGIVPLIFHQCDYRVCRIYMPDYVTPSLGYYSSFRHEGLLCPDGHLSARRIIMAKCCSTCFIDIVANFVPYIHKCTLRFALTRDADACSQNCVALLRRPPSAAPNSSLSATAYVPVAGGHSGKHAT